MLMRLPNVRTRGAWIEKGDHRDWGDWHWQECSPELYTAIDYIERHDPANSYDATKVAWLEDELMPRIARVGETGHPYFHVGDIIRVIGRS
jgi:hypothetical protein